MSEGTKKTAMLADVKVLDFTQYLAGPTITRFMAEMGAQIIKVEQAPMGDPARLLPAIKNKMAAAVISSSRIAVNRASASISRSPKRSSC